MQIIPQSVNLLDKDSLQLHKLSASQSKTNQHGKHLSESVEAHSGTCRPASLLEIPSESLTHITAFLDPTSLFSLGRTSKILHEHIIDDNTWRKAFACQFLGEQPERSDSQQRALLRRCEGTWKREFVARCNMIRRWDRCRNGTVSHTPHHSPVDSMHLLADRSYGPALLSVSLQYGVIARSFPVSGKVLKGFISASDGFGMGIGNPNAEFTPDVSTCAVVTDGWTARVAFGFMNGQVALASTIRVMESGRKANSVLRCRINEEHRGPVVNIVWNGMTFITASLDGEVRVWDAKRMKCVWVLKEQDPIIPDSCVHVVSDLERGVVLATKKSGVIVVWSGLSLTEGEGRVDVVPSASPNLRIILPGETADATKEPSHVFMDRSVPAGQLCFGVHLSGDLHFFRINVNLLSGQYDVIKFADGPLGPIQTVCPYFSTAKDPGRTVIFAGDSLGRVSLFDWSSNPAPGRESVSSFHKLDVNSDGGVSSIACNHYVLAIGTTRGMTRIYDNLTLRLMREFSSPIPRPNAGTTPVKQILLDRDLLVVAIGEKVLAWEAKPVRPHKQSHAVKKTPAKGRNAKWHKRLELAQDITESRKAVEDAHMYERRSHERRRAHQAALAGLGLDEHEALQYILMLSRDEAAQQDRVQQEESVFEADFDDVVPSVSVYHSSSRSGSDENRSPSLKSASPGTSSHTDVNSPLLLHPSPLDSDGLDSGRREITATGHPSAPPLEDLEHFPSISSSVSSTTSSLPRPSPPSVSASWSARLRPSVTESSSRTSGPTVPVATTSITRSVSGPPSSGRSLLSETLRLYERGEASASRAVSSPPRKDTDEGLDADLKLAMELSLAESLSLKTSNFPL